MKLWILNIATAVVAAAAAIPNTDDYSLASRELLDSVNAHLSAMEHDVVSEEEFASAVAGLDFHLGAPHLPFEFDTIVAKLNLNRAHPVPASVITTGISEYHKKIVGKKFKQRKKIVMMKFKHLVGKICEITDGKQVDMDGLAKLVQQDGAHHELKQAFEQLSKRDAKNLVNLSDYKFKLSTRDAKNIVNLANFELHEKRDAKNVVNYLNLESLADAQVDDTANEKREAKNVVDIFNLEGLAAAQFDDVQATEKNKDEKREAKNVVNIAQFAGIKDKREAKNVVNIAQFADVKDKREAKNVVNLANLAALADAEINEKREAKNVVDLASLQELADADVNEKRDAKNVVNLASLQGLAAADVNEKREAKNVVNLASLQGLASANLNEKRDINSAELLDGLADAEYLDKRDISHLQLFYLLKDAEYLDKREPKNIVEVAKFFQQHEKRKNVAKLPLFKSDKREIVDMSSMLDLSIVNRDTYSLADVEAVLALVNKRQELLTLLSQVIKLVLPQMRDILIFSGMIRDNAAVDAMTESGDKSLLILAPSDDAISKLSKKPWEFPESVEGKHLDAVAQNNLDNYLKGHVVEEFVSSFSGSTQAVLMNGKTVEITRLPAGDLRVSSGSTEVEVVDIKKQANGYVFVLNDSLVKP